MEVKIKDDCYVIKPVESQLSLGYYANTTKSCQSSSRTQSIYEGKEVKSIRRVETESVPAFSNLLLDEMR